VKYSKLKSTSLRPYVSGLKLKFKWILKWIRVEIKVDEVEILSGIVTKSRQWIRVEIKIDINRQQWIKPDKSRI